MGTNIRPFRAGFVIAFFFCLAGMLFAQENEDTRLTHRFSWTRDEFTMRYEVLIEKENNRGYSNIHREFTEEPFIIYSLLPGNYRLRIIPYDFLDIPGAGSRWRYFRVHAITTPDPAAEPQLVMEDLPQPIEEDFTEHMIITETDGVPPLERPVHRGLYAALLAEGLGYGRFGPSLGGGLTLGGSLNGMGVGISLLFAQDTEEFVSLEVLAHFRLYLPFTRTNTGLFVQAEGGIVLFADGQIDIKFSEHLSPAAGLCAGWRFPFSSRWYVEPIVRVGYPYIIGAGLSAGIKP